MRVAACRECSRTVSTEAVTCPYCGVPAPTSGPEAGRCTYCKTVMPVDALRCPECGGSAAGSRMPRTRERRVWPWVVGGALGFLPLAVLTYLGLQPASTASNSGVTSIASRIGSDCTLSDQTIGGITANDALEAVSAAAKGDRHFRAMVANGRARLVREGGHARVTAVDLHALKVRVLDGPSLGRELWVFEKYCE